ncbi:MAG: aromatic ring-hydroxylating dioxygenase subunit alpha [Alphaproteobacteria bacterium]|nr:aromatic ring-hydroxylating dioxygenase subunit alpha [Alphaproteobacteria bacterium]
MLITKQAVFRRFWYPIMPSGDLRGDAPKPFRLLDTDIVLWRDAAGAPAAVRDRCCHRTAKLSLGFVQDGAIACGYHGWVYGADGRLLRIPQAKDPTRATKIKVESYSARDAYGYVWVCLGEPLGGIPDIAESRDPGFRQIHEFCEEWNVSAFRIMENSFDNAHFSYVHRSSFGDVDNPVPAESEFEEHDWGFETRSVVPVKNPQLQQRNLRIDGDRTVRNNTRTWWLPFARKLRIRYPSGLIHIIVTAATPIADGRSLIVQFVLRNDTEADARAADIVAFDRQVTNEDRLILEATEADAPLDTASGEEFHMSSDKPGLIMRRKLAELLAAHGEPEMRHGAARPS